MEIGDWHRLTGASIGSYLGLVPSETSSGASRSQGGITKTGNSHARRLLIEAAWHHKAAYRPGKTMRQRWALAPAAAAARGDAGNRRLHHRWQVMTAHKKRHTVANTAIARELAGWVLVLGPSSTADPENPFTATLRCEGSSARRRTRACAVSTSLTRARSTSDTRPLSSRNQGPAVTSPRISD